MELITTPQQTSEKYRVSVDEYVRFREQGFLVVRGLVSPEHVRALNEHMDRLLAGQEVIEGAHVMADLGKNPRPLTPEDWLRVHMLHRISAIHERFMLHPRILDVLEALIGPDVLALQTMLFFKQPGQPGQGYHQDSYYIPTFPDTLCGAWLALTHADEENGCMWFTRGSQHEPIYPDPRGNAVPLQANLGDLGTIEHASHTDETVNGLTRVAQKYAGGEVPVPAEPGDVVFFAGHILHRSHTNRSDRSRRSFVGHYCNARSWVPWNAGDPYEGEAANDLHILARGDTHLPFAQPKFGTPCAATLTKAERANRAGGPMSMMADDLGMMTMSMHGEEEEE
ncbi:MAG: phytanoyl-CoA dioxygenase family protein [Anaerolineaceae bacterium]|nr:phytanoyl-CoA dioxygenase family protein [Anaerolineaceae bacterium]